MALNEKLSAADALVVMDLIEGTLDAWEQTAPDTVHRLGGRDALAARCEMTNPRLSPIPRLDVGTCERASREYEDRRYLHEQQ